MMSDPSIATCRVKWDSLPISLWVSGITSRATESYFTSFLSLAVHFNVQNISTWESRIREYTQLDKNKSIAKKVQFLTKRQWTLWSYIMPTDRYSHIYTLKFLDPCHTPGANFYKDDLT